MLANEKIYLLQSVAIFESFFDSDIFKFNDNLELLTKYLRRKSFPSYCLRRHELLRVETFSGDILFVSNIFLVNRCLIGTQQILFNIFAMYD